MRLRGRERVSTAVSGWLPPGAPYVFSPADLTPALWLDAADTSTITASGSPAKVSQWTNKGSLPSATQATAANQPTTDASTINGLNVLNFDGNDRFGSGAASDYLFLVDGTPHLIGFVAVAGNTADPNALYSFMGSTRTGSQTGMWIAYDDRVAASRNERLFHLVLNGPAGSTVVSNVTGDNAMAGNTATAVTLMVDPSNATAANRSKFYFGGGSAIQNNSSTGTPPTSIGNAFQIGASTSDAHLVGKFAEIVIVSGTAATETNRVLLRDYLIAKWGL